MMPQEPAPAAELCCLHTGISHPERKSTGSGSNMRSAEAAWGSFIWQDSWISTGMWL